MKKFNRKGFTMVELLIVLAIIAILAAVAIPVYSSQLENSRKKVDESNLRAATGLAAQDFLARNAGLFWNDIKPGMTGTPYTVYTLIDGNGTSDAKNTADSKNMVVYPFSGKVDTEGNWYGKDQDIPSGKTKWFDSIEDNRTNRQRTDYTQTGFNSGTQNSQGKKIILFPVQQNNGKGWFDIRLGPNGVIINSSIETF